MESCPRCGKDSPNHSLHCVHCGAKLASASKRTQFGMPALNLGDQTPVGGDEEKSTAEFAPEDLARLAMATEKKPSNPLSGLGGLKTGRRPGSLLKGLPQFRGAGQSPLTSGEFSLGKPGGLSGLGLYSAAKRSSLPPEAAPEVSVPAAQVAPEPENTDPTNAGPPDAEPAPTMAMQGVSDAALAQAATTDGGSSNLEAQSAADVEPAPTMAMQGVSDGDLATHAPKSDVLVETSVADAPTDMTKEEPQVAHRVAPVQVTKPARRSAEPGAADPVERTEAASKPLSAAPLPASMRGSERAHHPGDRGVTQARVSSEGGSSAKWIIGLILLIGIGVGVWMATRG